MRRITTCLAGIGLIGIGYLLGTTDALSPARVFAQADPAETPAETPADAPINEETLKKIKDAYDAMKVAQEALVADATYVPATTNINALAIFAGGIDAVKDLESGRGVDPETFAALYGGLATEAIAAKLERDPENRLLYNQQPVRMYSVSRLKKLYDLQQTLSDKPAETPTEEAPAE